MLKEHFNFATQEEEIRRLWCKVKQLEREKSEHWIRRWHTLPYMATVSLDMLTHFNWQLEEDENGEIPNITKLTIDKFHKYIMQYINIEREWEI